jgi:hypothetical protein
VKLARFATIGAVVACSAAFGGFWLLTGPATAGVKAAAATSDAEPGARGETPRFERSYRYASGETGEAAIKAAVEEAVRELNPLIRGIARRRMLDANKVIPQLGFDLSGDPLVASYVGGRVIEAPADGRPVAWTDQYGDTVQVTHRVTNGALLQTMAGSKGDRRNRYRFSDDGKSMTMSVDIRSARLPSPLQYSLEYRRIE